MIVSGQQIIPTPTGENPCPQDTPCGAFSVAKNFRSPYNINFSFQLEQSLGGKAFMQIGYVGSQGRKLLSLLNINQPIANGTPTASDGAFANISIGGNYYSDVNQIQSIGTSNYNSLQAIFRTTSWHGFTSQLAYTWGHNLDEVTAYRGALPQNSYDFKGDYGASDFDTRNSVVGYINYDIPTFKGPKVLTAGWQVNSAFSFKGGQPITVYTSSDNSGTNEGVQRPNQIANPLLGMSHKLVKPSDGTPYVQWLNTNAYEQPADGTWGNVPRNNVFGPGFSDVDFSVFKNTKFNIHDFPGQRSVPCGDVQRLQSPEPGQPGVHAALQRLLGWIERLCGGIRHHELHDWVGQLLARHRPRRTVQRAAGVEDHLLIERVNHLVNNARAPRRAPLLFLKIDELRCAARFAKRRRQMKRPRRCGKASSFR